jgi:hypothetical protein
LLELFPVPQSPFAAPAEELVEKFKISFERFEFLLNLATQRCQFNHLVLAWVRPALRKQKSLQALFHDLLTQETDLGEIVFTKTYICKGKVIVGSCEPLVMR